MYHLFQDMFLDYMCQCAAGYEGRNCSEETECDPNPCQNGASCTVSHQCSPGHVCCSVTVFYSISHPQDLTADYNCSCASGFTGRTCAEEEGEWKGEATAPLNGV